MCEEVSKVVDRPVGWIVMITRSMKRIVLSIIEASRDLVDAKKKNPGLKKEADVSRALERLERAVQRLDRIEHAKSKVD